MPKCYLMANNWDAKYLLDRITDEEGEEFLGRDVLEDKDFHGFSRQSWSMGRIETDPDTIDVLFAAFDRMELLKGTTWTFICGRLSLPIEF